MTPVKARSVLAKLLKPNANTLPCGLSAFYVCGWMCTNLPTNRVFRLNLIIVIYLLFLQEQLNVLVSMTLETIKINLVTEKEISRHGGGGGAAWKAPKY